MNEIEKVLQRANLQQIRAFLLTGCGDVELEEETYSERIKKVSISNLSAY